MTGEIEDMEQEVISGHDLARGNDRTVVVIGSAGMNATVRTLLATHTPGILVLEADDATAMLDAEIPLGKTKTFILGDDPFASILGAACAIVDNGMFRIPRDRRPKLMTDTERAYRRSGTSPRRAAKIAARMAKAQRK